MLKPSRAIANQNALKQQLSEKEEQLEDIVLRISAVVVKISKLSQNFFREAAKIQRSLNKVQASRPRGNPANQWPHRPITGRISAFYQAKDESLFLGF